MSSKEKNASENMQTNKNTLDMSLHDFQLVSIPVLFCFGIVLSSMTELSAVNGMIIGAGLSFFVIMSALFITPPK